MMPEVARPSFIIRLASDSSIAGGRHSLSVITLHTLHTPSHEIPHPIGISMLFEPLLDTPGTKRASTHLSLRSLHIGCVAIGALMGAALFLAAIYDRTTPDNLAISSTQIAAASQAAAPSHYWHGVSLGGWLVMEINPSSRGPGSPLDVRPRWMFDQLQAASELDFVASLRANSDEFAVRTMRNHWEGYLPDDALDRAKALGVDATRIPVRCCIPLSQRAVRIIHPTRTRPHCRWDIGSPTRRSVASQRSSTASAPRGLSQVG